MKRIVSATVIAGALVVGVLTASSVLASDGRPPDERALAPTRGAPSRSIEQRVDPLLAKMTTKEKLQQVQLLSDGQITDADAKAGVGGVFSLVDPAKIDHFQHIAVEQSRLHIPILFAYDTIHGYRTIFPVPLGAASSFDPDGRRRPTPRSAPASPRRSASSRSTARWSTSPTSRAGAGSSRATARTRTSAR